MLKPATLFGLTAIGIVCSQSIVGCSAPEPKASPHASQAEILQGQVTKANTFLDKLEDQPAEQRNITANAPRMASTLRAASADPEIKKRMTSLGINLQ